MVPGLGPRKLMAKSVEPLPNSVGVTAASSCDRTGFRLRPLALLNSGRALKDRLVLKLGRHFS